MTRLLPLSLLVLVGCFRAPPPPSEPTAISVPGLHNVFRLSDRVYSGSGPDGETAFAALRGLGVRTIITVDGATPDVAAARKYGLRYVHIPIGYDRVPDESAWRLARAVRDLTGLVYVHCHHGKHRGPAAAAAVMMCTGEWGPNEAAAWLKAAGTDPRYRGLVGLPRTFHPPPGGLDAVPADFPETATVPDLTRAMVAIDERWDRIKAAKAAGWAVPPDHPDVDPPHEVVQFAELFRELHRGPDPREHRTGFQKMLSEVEVEAGELERAVRATPVEKAAADKAFAACGATCAKCHARTRD